MGHRASQLRPRVVLEPDGNRFKYPIKGADGEARTEKHEYTGMFIGCLVLCRDEFRSKYTGDLKFKWRAAEITDIDGMKVLVHYTGWSSKYDTWVDLVTEGTRLAPLRLLSMKQRDSGLPLTEDQIEFSYQYLVTGKLPPENELPVLADDVDETNDVDTLSESCFSEWSQSTRSTSISNLSSAQGSSICARASDTYSIGQKVHVQDIFRTKKNEVLRKWRDAEIVEMRGSHVKVHFLGWDSKWDTVIDIVRNRDRIRQSDGLVTSLSSSLSLDDSSVSVGDQEMKTATASSKPRRSSAGCAENAASHAPYLNAVSPQKHSRLHDSPARFCMSPSRDDGSVISSASMDSIGGGALPLSTIMEELDETGCMSKRNSLAHINTGAGTGSAVCGSEIDCGRKVSNGDVGKGDRERVNEAILAARRRIGGTDGSRSRGAASIIGGGGPCPSPPPPTPSSSSSSKMRSTEDRLAALQTWSHEGLTMRYPISPVGESQGFFRPAKALEDALVNRMELEGLHVYPVGSDGSSSLFRAISFQLYGSEERYRELCQRCAEHMRRYSRRFEVYCTGSIDDRLCSISRGLTVPGDLEIRALEEIFDRVCYVYSVDTYTEDCSEIPKSTNIDECNLLAGVLPLRVAYFGNGLYQPVIDQRGDVAFPLEDRKGYRLVRERIRLFEYMFVVERGVNDV